MKRTAIRRKTPLRARVGQVFKRSTTKHARRERAPAYMAWVRSLPCYVVQLAEDHEHEHDMGNETRCAGPVEADHAGLKTIDGDGTRARDATCIPLCHGHHMERHDFAGTFKSWSQSEMRVFLATAIAVTQARAREAGVEVPTC